MKHAYLAALFLTACHPAPVAAAPAPTAMRVQAAASLKGDWVMHLYVGPTHFADQVHFATNTTGTLTVTGKWTAPLEKVRLAGDELSFELTAPEAPKPFRVFYQGHLDPGATTFTGFATLADGSLLGGFVAQKQDPK